MKKNEHLSPEVIKFAESIQLQLNKQKNTLAKSPLFNKTKLDDNEIRFRIGYKLNELRKDADYTLAEVNEKTGVSIAFISDIENGRTSPSISTLVLLANFYDMSMSAFCALCEL